MKIPRPVTNALCPDLLRGCEQLRHILLHLQKADGIRIWKGMGGNEARPRLDKVVTMNESCNSLHIPHVMCTMTIIIFFIQHRITIML